MSSSPTGSWDRYPGPGTELMLDELQVVPQDARVTRTPRVYLTRNASEREREGEGVPEEW